MVCEQLLAKRTAILEKWAQLILDTYPTETSRFLYRENDQFLNPVGCAISREIAVIFDEMLNDEMNDVRLTISLDNIIRIRAVQVFTPAQAIGFIFLLKQAVREGLAVETGGNASKELFGIESRIDKIALLAFDIYTKCKEEICDLRISEVLAQKEMVLRMLERVNIAGGQV